MKSGVFGIHFCFFSHFLTNGFWPRSVGKNGRNLGWVGFAWTLNFEALETLACLIEKWKTT